LKTYLKLKKDKYFTMRQ